MYEHFIRPESLRETYPDGIIIYHQPSSALSPLFKLNRLFPRHFIAVSDFSVGRQTTLFFGNNWATDLGSQIGDRIYGSSDVLDELFKYLPGYPEIKEHLHFQFGDSEFTAGSNGLMVPIGGSNVVIHQGLRDKAQQHFTNEGMTVINADNIREQIYDETNQNGPISIPSGHIDAIITGFCSHNTFQMYVDERYDATDVADKLHALGDVVVNKVHWQQADQGALNIRYIDTPNSPKVVVPSINTLGEIANELKLAGYEIVELGDEQVSNGGGVKCRMQLYSWKKGHA